MEDEIRRSVVINIDDDHGASRSTRRFSSSRRSGGPSFHSLSQSNQGSFSRMALFDHPSDDNFVGGEARDASDDVIGSSSASAGFDDQLLKRVVADCGQWAAGIVYVQLWVLNEDKNRLVRPEAGWWLDDVFHACPAECDDDDCKSSRRDACQLCRLVDPTHPRYVAAKPLPIGVGVAGILWASAAQGLKQRNNHEDHRHQSRIVWRDIQQLANDPDQPYDERLQLMAQCGFGRAGAVPFSVMGEEGIVVCMTRSSDQVNMDRLCSPTNEAYLFSCAQLIGSAFVFRAPRREVVRERKEETRATLRRVRLKLVALRAFGVDLVEYCKANEEKNAQMQRRRSSIKANHRSSFTMGNENFMEEKPTKSMCQSSCVDALCCLPGIMPSSSQITQKVSASLKKFKGAGVQPPPAMSWEQTAWTFMGCLLTLMMLTSLHKHLNETHGRDHGIALPPFGAFCTLLYGLTAAPASQPRNAMLGQILSLLVGYSFARMDGLENWLKQSLSTSIVIAGMVKLGITHPPAGASALLFSTGTHSWWKMLYFLIANVLAILAATIIQNFSNRRQYPTYWGLREIKEFSISIK